MLSKVLKRLWLVLFLTLFVASCGGGGERVTTPGPVVLASPQPSATPTATAIQPSVTPTIPPRATLTRVAPSATATLPQPEETASPIPPSATPTSLPPSATPAPVPPTDTPTLTPTLTSTVPPEHQTNDPASSRVELQQIAGGLDRPVAMAIAGDGSQRLFIAEKPGRIRIVRGGEVVDTAFLDITDRVGASASEQGLLGLAFHPHYSQNGLFFVNYTDRQGNTVIARFSVSADPSRAEPASEAVLLTLDQPASNHNGGHLAFGPDGFLYVGTGDGGAAGDAFGNGQNGGTLLGAMLRLDVDGGQPYAVPAGNPFVGNAAVRDEIWAIGLRNPWRYSFDRLTGDLYIADVGQNRYEEVNVQPGASRGGQNYGWPLMEGSHCFPQERSCDRTGLALPVAEYDHSLGCSVTGGYVYRGVDYPQLTGIYLFGDYCSGRIWGLAPTETGAWQVAELGQANVRPSSFGQDSAGELYLLDLEGGDLYKIAAYQR